MLAVADSSGAKRPLTIHFSFQAYARNVKVVRPLVGPWQLGVARIRGSGTLRGDDIRGAVVHVTDPLYSRFRPALMRAQVIGYRYVGRGADVKLALMVEITSASGGGPRCERGTQGKIKLHDSPAKLSNGERSDYVLLGRWTAGRCPTFLQRWTNEDGGPRTSPARGGPPNGGQWAIVKISTS
jgi:hypothetical protein